MHARGAFIVFEGIDRCGKSTQVKKLFDSLKANNTPTELMRFPNRETDIGKYINQYLTQKEFKMTDHCIHLLFSMNRWEQADTIKSTLQSGKTIICDRYAFSGVAFTAAKGLDLLWCKDPDRGLPAPDLVVYLDISIDEASKRGQYGEERYENKDFQKKVKDIYEGKLKSPSWLVVDATLPIEEIHKQIRDASLKVISEVNNKPIEKLWTDRN